MSRPASNPRTAFGSVRIHVCIFLVFGLVYAAQRFAPIAGVSDSIQSRSVDALMIAANCFAIWCCGAAGFRRSGVFRSFWILFGSTLVLQLCGNLGWAYIHYSGAAVSDTSMFPSLFYRLYAGPMAIALFLSEDLRGSRFRSFLDGCIVVGLVGLTMYQVQMAEQSAHDPKIWQSITLGTAVNTLLVLAAALRFVFSTPGALSALFRRQVIYLLAYYCVSVVTSIAEAYFSRLSDYGDFLWIATYLLAAGLAGTWRPAGNEAPGVAKISRRTSLLCFNLTLAVLVLTSAILGLRLVNSTRLVGLAGVGVVLFSFAIRSALMQDSQEKTLTQLQASRAELRRQALYDALTGLPNRRLLGDRLSQALAAAKRDEKRVALLYLDLDGFKPVNDQLGHATGDQVLVEVGTRMQARTRESDTLARVGGDEFILLMTHVTAGAQAELLAREVLKSLNEPIELGNRIVNITASVGIGLFPDDSLDGEALMEHADRAMYVAKRRGKNLVEFYSSGLRDPRKTGCESGLRQSVGIEKAALQS